MIHDFNPQNALGYNFLVTAHCWLPRRISVILLKTQSCLCLFCFDNKQAPEKPTPCCKTEFTYCWGRGGIAVGVFLWFFRFSISLNYQVAPNIYKYIHNSTIALLTAFVSSWIFWILSTGSYHPQSMALQGGFQAPIYPLFPLHHMLAVLVVMVFLKKRINRFIKFIK